MNKPGKKLGYLRTKKAGANRMWQRNWRYQFRIFKNGNTNYRS